jgi:MFS family permease
LDGTTTWQFQSRHSCLDSQPFVSATDPSAFTAYATSTVFKNQYSSSIDTAAAIILAVGKPLMAKIADVFGRGESYCAVIVLYCIGYIVKASATGLGGLAAGTLIYS